MSDLLGNDVFREHGPLTAHNYIVPTKNSEINLCCDFPKMDIFKMSNFEK